MTTRTTEYRYNADGLLEELVCRNGEEGEQVTRWEYGTELNEDGTGIARADVMRAKVYPDGGAVEYGYNRLSEVTRQEDQDGTVHEYEYDAVSRFAVDRATTLGPGIDGAVRAIRMSYFARGEISKVTSYNSPSAIGSINVFNEVLFAYNGFGQEVNEWQSHAGPANTGTTPGVAYGYENGSANTIRLGAAVFPHGNAVEYAYSSVLDDAFDLVSAIGPSGVTPEVAYARLGLSSVVRTAYGCGLEMTVIKLAGEAVGDAGDPYNGLDRFGRLQEARWMTSVGSIDVERVEYGFDRAGNRKWRRNLRSGAEPWDEFYRYDGLYQITGLDRGKLNVNRTGVNGVPVWQGQWRYDEMGNWLGYNTAINGAAGLEQERTYNAANELLFIDGSNARLGRDGAGNMTVIPKPESWSQGLELKWDAWNRLVEITDQETEIVVAKYAYDGLTRRVTRETEFEATPVLRHFYYSMNWQVVEERVDDADGPERQFFWGIKHMDDLVYREQFDSLGVPTNKQWALNDGKNVTAVAGPTAAIEERFAYDAFGKPIPLGPGFEPLGGSVTGWETLFCGYRWDEESGLNQVRYRYYHPELGRWLSRDPLGEKWFRHLGIPDFVLGRTELYVYSRNSPGTLFDPLGLVPGPLESPRHRCLRQGGCLQWVEKKNANPIAPGNGCDSAPEKQMGCPFTPACDRHDECYQECESGKSECDKEFYENLKHQCRTCFGGNQLLLVNCYVAAWAYYTAVTWATEASVGYRNAQNARCECRCIKAHPDL